MPKPLYKTHHEGENKTTVPTMRVLSTTTQHRKALTLAQVDGGADYHLPTQNITNSNNNYAQPCARPNLQQQHSGQVPLRTRNVPTAPPPPPPPPPPSQRRHSQSPENTVRDLLPYCTTEPPLNEAQVIALSDVVGSLRELMLLALAAASDDVDSVRRLAVAVGQQTAVNVIEFFADEWEMEG